MQIAIPIRPQSMEHGLELLEKVVSAGADLVEIWCDSFDWEKELIELVKASDLPVIVTLKDAVEKGKFAGDMEVYKKFVQKAARINEVLYVDVGFHRLDEELAEVAGGKLLASYHDFERLPTNEELNKVVEVMTRFAPKIIKLACACKSKDDAERLLEWQDSYLQKWADQRVIIGMGEVGKVTRLQAAIYQNAFTFAALTKELATAPGQVTVAELRGI